MDSTTIYELSQLKEWLYILAFLAIVGTVLYMIAITIRRKQRMTMQQHVLDKFASAKDFAEFLQSEAGQKYLMGFTDAAASPRSSILNSVRLGIVLVFAGAGLHIQDVAMAARRVGMMLMMIGIGFLVSAAVSYVLARKLKLNGTE